MAQPAPDHAETAGLHLVAEHRNPWRHAMSNMICMPSRAALVTVLACAMVAELAGTRGRLLANPPKTARFALQTPATRTARYPQRYPFGYYLGGYRYPFAYPYYRYGYWRFTPPAFQPQPVPAPPPPGLDDVPDYKPEPGGTDQNDSAANAAPQLRAPPPLLFEEFAPPAYHGPWPWAPRPWYRPGWYGGWWWWTLPGGFWLTPPIEYFNPDELDLSELPAERIETPRDAANSGRRVFGPYRPVR